MRTFGEPVVYLDHAASTPMRPEAVEAMTEWIGATVGNSTGAHRVARAARRAVDDARDVLADALGCRPGELVLTSGGTESDNLAVLGGHASKGGTVVSSAIEHHAVSHAAARVDHREVGVDRHGRVCPDALADTLVQVHRDGGHVGLVAVMAANNEVGTVQDLPGLAAVVEREAPGALFHVDAVAGFAWLDIASLAAAASTIAVSAHKFGGPQGVGALVVREPAQLVARAVGGGQERERRAGTHNVAGIVAMAAAARATVAERAALVARATALRDRLVDGLGAALDGVIETVPERAAKTAGCAHVCFEGVDSEALLFLLDEAGVCASAASSCASGALQVSHVLVAMGVPNRFAAGSVRFSLGYSTTEADIEAATKVTVAAVERLRGGG